MANGSCYKSGMSHFHLPIALLLAAAFSVAGHAHAAEAAAPVARGLIVQLKATPDGRESAQAQRDRLASIAADAGLGGPRPMAVGASGHLLPFARPLSGADLQAAERRMRLHPEVASVEPDVRMKRAAEPNDPYYVQSIQWHLKTPAAGGPAAINLPPAWDRTTGAANQVVAVLDTGVVYSHPDLAGKLLPGYDMISDADTANDGGGRDNDPSDPGDWVTAAEANSARFPVCDAYDSSWHGTFIAGMIGAASNNGLGVTGVNWQARILPVRVSGKCGAWLSDIVDGMRWAAGLPVAGAPPNPYPARVINLSFGGDSACGATYQSAINDVRAVGSLVVVATGNQNGPVTRPADCLGVLGVGAVRQDGLKTYYSNYGANVGIMAPGGPGAADNGPRLYSTSNEGTRGPGFSSYASKDGTSFATPLAAGVASLMLAVNPTLTPPEIVSRIQAGARAFPSNPAYPTCSVATPTSGPCNCTRESCGPGLLDADRALQLATSPAVLIAPISPVVVGTTVSLDGRGSSGVSGSTLVSYQWSQVSGNPALVIQNARSPLASVTLPTNGTWVFRLLVTDSLGRSADNYVTVVAGTGGASGGGSGGGSSGTGGGALALGWGAGLWALGLAALWTRRGSRRESIKR